jgi:hypothetical protein
MNFHLDYDSVGEIYETYQFDYLRRLVRPVFRSTVRDVMGRYTAEEIYSTKRAEVENLIQEEASEVLKQPGNNIVMKSLLIRSITLPAQIKTAIENKLQQEQEALAYQYRLDREKSEAERIRIEAQGRADANRIINNSLTPNLLRMRGIEATSKLAESPNSKVVVVGSGKDGLPIILGNNSTEMSLDELADLGISISLPGHKAYFIAMQAYKDAMQRLFETGNFGDYNIDMDKLSELSNEEIYSNLIDKYMKG